MGNHTNAIAQQFYREHPGRVAEALALSSLRGSSHRGQDLGSPSWYDVEAQHKPLSYQVAHSAMMLRRWSVHRLVEGTL